MRIQINEPLFTEMYSHFVRVLQSVRYKALATSPRACKWRIANVTSNMHSHRCSLRKPDHHSQMPNAYMIASISHKMRLQAHSNIKAKATTEKATLRTCGQEGNKRKGNVSQTFTISRAPTKRKVDKLLWSRPLFTRIYMRRKNYCVAGTQQELQLPAKSTTNTILHPNIASAIFFQITRFTFSTFAVSNGLKTGHFYS